MFIVDTQVHIWREETPDRPWVPGAGERIRLNGHREEPFSYAECLALMDEAGLTYSDTIEQFTDHFLVTEDELEWIMGRGICECLDWPVPVTA